MTPQERAVIDAAMAWLAVVRMDDEINAKPDVKKEEYRESMRACDEAQGVFWDALGALDASVAALEAAPAVDELRRDLAVAGDRRDWDECNRLEAELEALETENPSVAKAAKALDAETFRLVRAAPPVDTHAKLVDALTFSRATFLAVNRGLNVLIGDASEEHNQIKAAVRAIDAALEAKP